MKDLIIRCSALGHIMGDNSENKELTSNQKKEYQTLINKKTPLTEKQAIKLENFTHRLTYKPDYDLSKAAKSEVQRIVDERIYGYDSFVGNKQTEKGLRVEDDSIKLYNNVFFTDYKKHFGRVTIGNLTGECDLLKPKIKVIDIKSSWNSKTFKKLESDIDSSLYEWQGRGYMKLYKVPMFQLAYCLVDTPDELIPTWEDLGAHIVSHINPFLRVTTKDFEKDAILEEKIDYKINEAIKYSKFYESQLKNKNK